MTDQIAAELDAAVPPKLQRTSSAAGVIDPRHLIPPWGTDYRWYRYGVERVRLGYTYNVFSQDGDVVISFFKGEHGRLVMRAVSTKRGLCVTVETQQRPTDGGMRLLLRFGENAVTGTL